MSKKKFVVVTTKCRSSFLSVFTPKIWNEGEEGKYEATLIFDSQKDIENIVSCVKTAIKDTYGDKAPEMDMPWKDGNTLTDKEGNIREGYQDKVVIRTSSKFAPVVIDQKLEPIDALCQDRLQSGDYVKAKLEAFCWEYAGKKGVTLYLKAIQLIAEGERFGGGGNDVSGFDEVAGGSDGDLF